MRPLSLVGFLAVLSASVQAQATIGPVSALHIVNAPIAPDGYLRHATLVNGQFPGPLIKAKKGDNFELNVINHLQDSSLDLETSIHWHGIFQRTTNYLDGAAFVTQCPIIPKESFLYKFNAREQTGTYWYHSHFKAQYCDGLRGPLVIYDPNDPHKDQYDIDDASTVITLADWYHYSSLEAPLDPVQLHLNNGKGHYMGGPIVDFAVVNVIRGQRYRLRIVSISCDPGFVFSIDSHQLTIIEVDGNNVQPLVVDSLEILAGQRYSVVLAANQEIDNYWIRALPDMMMMMNQMMNQSFTDFTNLAILRYVGASPQSPSNDPTVNIPMSMLPLNEKDLHPLDVKVDPVPGQPFPGGADININLNVTLSDDFTEFLINGFTFDAPIVPVLLQILNGQKRPILSLKEASTVLKHPIHLHGHSFHVVRSAGSSTYNFDNPVIRDVVSIGDQGDNVTIRFFTDNPGPWFLHCHMDWHLKKGFAVVFAEDVPEVSTKDIVNDQWRDLCPAYDKFVNANDPRPHHRHALKTHKDKD
ncbi:laccase [Lactifluus volemus]|nr:laccase [Lactifluus volemus]